MSWFYFAILGSLLTSLAAIFEKRVLRNEHSLEFATLLSIFLALLSIPVLVAKGLPDISLQWLALIYGESVLASVAYVLITKAIRHLDVSFVSPFLLLGPVISSVTAYFFLNEKISIIQGAGIALILLGGYVLEKKNVNLNHGKSKYILLILVALVLYSLTVLVDKVAISVIHIPAIQYLALVQIFIAINILIIRFFWGQNDQALRSGLMRYGPAVLVVAILTFGYRYFQLNAVALAAIGLASTVKHSSSLITTILGGGYFKEKNLESKVMATVLMLGGVALLVL